jgi:hypothetical protein
MPIPRETLGLREAAEHFGVSVDTLRRRIKDDAMPEAFKAEGKFGSTWVVPLEAMADIADRERWALQLPSQQASTPPSPSPDVIPAVAEGSAHGIAQALPNAPDASAYTLPSHLPSGDTAMPSVMVAAAPTEIRLDSAPVIREENLEWVERLLAAETRAAGAETRLHAMETEEQAAERRIAQLTRDLEHERAELRRLRTDLSNEEKAKAVAQARTDELRGQLKRDRVDLEARIGLAKVEAEAHLERADSLHTSLGEAHAAMGWWSKRRLSKTTALGPITTDK